jgi:hypothetical protein
MFDHNIVKNKILIVRKRCAFFLQKGAPLLETKLSYTRHSSGGQIPNCSVKINTNGIVLMIETSTTATTCDSAIVRKDGIRALAASATEHMSDSTLAVKIDIYYAATKIFVERLVRNNHAAIIC